MSIKYYLLIALLILATTIPGLGALEFYRHTEADRTLISQEMLENHNFVVPTLLGQPILTKPPVYYILSALIFKVSGDYSEFDSRLLSVFAACMLAIIHFMACRYENLAIQSCLGSTLVLISSLSFFNLSSVAEIDMLYATFCAGSLYLLYFSLQNNSFALLVFSYLLAALAFLVKGPPIIVFYALSSLSFYFLIRKNNLNIFRYLSWNILGLICFFLVLSIWFVPLLEHVDFAILKEQFNQEILGRAVGEPRKSRGIFFYVGTILGATLPWNLLAIVYLLVKKPVFKFTNNKNFISFCLIVLLSGLIVLSIAKGKSSRYIFPLHTFAIQLLYFVLASSNDFWQRDRVRFYIKIFLYLATTSVVVAGLALSIKLNSYAIIYFLPMILFTVLPVFTTNIKKIFVSLVLCVLSSRLVLTQVYYPYRNSKKTVKPIVESIMAETKSEPIYSAGMYERWVSYYLKRRGRQVIQLQGLKSYRPTEASIYWLITDKDENDLLELVKKDSDSRLIRSYLLPNTNMYFYLTPTTNALEMLDYIKKTRKDDGIY